MTSFGSGCVSGPPSLLLPPLPTNRLRGPGGHCCCFFSLPIDSSWLCSYCYLCFYSQHATWCLAPDGGGIPICASLWVQVVGKEVALFVCPSSLQGSKSLTTMPKVSQLLSGYCSFHITHVFPLALVIAATLDSSQFLEPTTSHSFLKGVCMCYSLCLGCLPPQLLPQSRYLLTFRVQLKHHFL